MSRLEFSRKTRAKIIARANGRCEKCAAVLKIGEGEIDHILPCALGGLPETSNGRLLCRVCHKEKTADDIRRTRKADRMRDRRTGAMPKSARPMQGRQFPRTKEPRAPKQRLPPARLFRAKDDSHA